MLFHILIFATSGKYQNKEKPLKRQRKLGLVLYEQLNRTQSFARNAFSCLLPATSSVCQTSIGRMCQRTITLCPSLTQMGKHSIVFGQT